MAATPGKPWIFCNGNASLAVPGKISVLIQWLKKNPSGINRKDFFMT
jgi:hypothetical protein